MTFQKLNKLDPGYTSEVDTVNEPTWCQVLQDFDDANIYQTWPFAAVAAGRRNISHVILRHHGVIVAAAQARIAKLPVLNAGIAYIRWGPLWRRRATEVNVDIFRQAVRALRNEFAFQKGLVLRLLPIVVDDDSPLLSAILAEEGFSASRKDTRSRTILMDLSPQIEELRGGMRPHWKRELKVAERKGLEIVEGSDDELFGSLIEIHKEMVSRKHFTEGNDINQFRLIQAQLPESLKMRIMLCKSDSGVCAGLVCSAIGKTALYLFGATSDIGMKSNGSYLLHWKLIQHLKEEGRTVYDLNGINPVRNPGPYKFKSDLAGNHGKDVQFLGQFDARVGTLSSSIIDGGDWLRSRYRTLKGIGATTRVMKLKWKAEN